MVTDMTTQLGHMVHFATTQAALNVVLHKAIEGLEEKVKELEND